MTLEEFKNKFKDEIHDLMLNEEEVKSAYNCYQEDPQAFHPSMLSSFQE